MLLPKLSPGFTLIELLLVIAIVGIISALTLPGLNGIYERQLLSNSANELVTSIKSMQSRALLLQRPSAWLSCEPALSNQWRA